MKDGTEELRQLAHLLKMGANTARDIAVLRNVNDAQRISALADQADAMADSLDRIAADGSHGDVHGHATVAG